MSQYLQFGYLGLLALLVVLCFRIIEASLKNQRPFRETIIILICFSLISIVGGVAGYLWASKELDVAKTKESTAEILNKQLNAIREAHLRSMNPLQSALDNASNKMSNSVLNTTRKEYISEINEINAIIQERETQLNKNISLLNEVFNKETE